MPTAAAIRAAAEVIAADLNSKKWERLDATVRAHLIDIAEPLAERALIAAEEHAQTT